MSFREDLDALRAKADALEQDNAELRAQMEPLRREAADAEAFRRRVDRLEGEVRRIRPGRHAAVAVFALLIGSLLGATGLRLSGNTLEHELRMARREESRLADEVEILRAQELRLEAELARTRIETRPDFDPVQRSGRVVEARGEAPAAVDDACSVELRSDRAGGYDCRAEVRCGGRLIYGGGQFGYIQCAYVQGRPTTARDVHPSGDAGDPRFVLDLPGDRVVVSDDPEPRYEVVIELEP